MTGKKIRIWIMTSEFPPGYGGGISTYALETAKMFSSYGHEVTVITQNSGVNSLTIKKSGAFHVVFFNPDKYFTTSFLGYEANLSYAFAQAVKELIGKQGMPDIVESQEYMGIAYFLLQYKHLGYELFRNLKVVITLHAPSFLYLEFNKVPLYQLPYFWTGEMERSCIRSADLLISPSRYLIGKLKERMKTDDLDIHVIRNPYQFDVNDKKPETEKNKLVFFGKLTPQKGCLELIDQFRRLWTEGFQHPLFMIGGGEHLYHPEGVDMTTYIRKSYKKEITSGKLRLLGSIKPQALGEYLDSAHVVIVPSLVDNLPYTVPEAMSRKKIVLASVYGGQSEIIDDGVDGFLFDPKNNSSLRSQINRILSLSEKELKDIGEKASSKTERLFSFSSVYEGKMKALNVLLASERSVKNFPLIRPIKASADWNNSGKEKGLLSVVIPYYNMGHYVADAVKSVAASTHHSIEIIIINDGSDEPASIEKLKKLEREYTVSVLHKANEGLASARNFGAAHAKGEYLAFLDPDDTVEPDYYAKAIAVLKQYDNVCFVGCWARYFGDASGYWPTFNPEPPFLLIHNMINSSALVYKHNAFIKAGMNDPAMIFGMEDYDSVISMVENGCHGVVLPEALWNYRVRKDSMARAFTREKQLYLYALMAGKHKNIYATFATESVNILNANGPGFNYNNPTLYTHFPGGEPVNSKIKQLIVRKIKSNKLLHKAALRIKKSL